MSSPTRFLYMCAAVPQARHDLVEMRWEYFNKIVGTFILALINTNIAMWILNI
jgi:hypothetical protein